MFYVSNKASKFWAGIINTWCKYNFSGNISNWYAVCRQTIWLNSHIRVGGAPIFLKSWYDQGIVYLSDLVLENEKRFYTWQELIRKYHIGSTFLQYYSILAAIPSEWNKINYKWAN